MGREQEEAGRAVRPQHSSRIPVKQREKEKERGREGKEEEKEG